MSVPIFGLDCATEDAKVGVARAVWTPNSTVLDEVRLCGKGCSPVDLLASWVTDPSTPAILAIDAPLGWPAPLGPALSSHTAGDGLTVDAHCLFRRATDRFIQKHLRKTPLDVGADRIARTAHAALGLLAALRARLGAAIPLAWDHPVEALRALEVYPAATLVAHRVRSSGYKKREAKSARREIIDALSGRIQGVDKFPILADNADTIDALVCVLAAKDFLEGRAMRPHDLRLAEQEGWIWAAAPSL